MCGYKGMHTSPLSKVGYKVQLISFNRGLWPDHSDISFPSNTSLAKALYKLLNHQELVWFDISLATTESIVRRAEKIPILLSYLTLIIKGRT